MQIVSVCSQQLLRGPTGAWISAVSRSTAHQPVFYDLSSPWSICSLTLWTPLCRILSWHESLYLEISGDLRLHPPKDNFLLTQLRVTDYQDDSVVKLHSKLKSSRIHNSGSQSPTICPLSVHENWLPPMRSVTAWNRTGIVSQWQSLEQAFNKLMEWRLETLH